MCVFVCACVYVCAYSAVHTLSNLIPSTCVFSVGEWHSEVMKTAKKEIFDQEVSSTTVLALKICLL